MFLTQNLERLSLILGSSITGFLIAFILAPWFTKLLIKFKIGKQIRENAISGEKAELFNALHAKKSGTPTMGGLLIWGTVLVVIIISRIASGFGLFDRSLLNRKETWIPIFTMVTCGILGAIDDYLNIKGVGKTKGISAKLKTFWLIVFSAAGGWWFYEKLGFTSISIPISGVSSIELGWWYIPLFIFVINATANSVNFTDGLDGLASGLLIMSFGAFGIIAFVKGMFILAALCGVICGTISAFLWFNVPPAKFYMGDTGSLALGATLGVIAMLTDQALTLPLIGFIYVIETLSVIIQLFSKKFFKRKVFKIAPIHHHFEQSGWAEFTVVMRFWIIGGIMTSMGVVLALSTLK
ncbi:phospho-N-acetylmuramoyl-pentapeptide-transferase [Candidatus Peregrinibacteria bacterium CG_4_10_14_0_2_um_filter_38_24]|nr:MAG: phospho-N-acetylmuramoyl-pentapeptide-transferase [Candidatus Peregrinibacteria bacterium CG_4_10_14_0_2_um_filter_38_24]PJC38644.1 MAG: phospho-N-acetylmuramoyl-pentapeptide-transferase [Candidatus Peregrinibacteria bacterium CG_4_9_14_0_2_um_filter_38_9]